LETGYVWDTGLVRKLNEDSIFCSTFDLRTHSGTVSAGLIAVADGMGGHDAGEIASDLAIRAFQAECISGLLTHPSAPGLPVMAAAFSKANSAVVEAAAERSLQGMGTTLTAALIIGQDMYIAHIGDSRCYIINSRETIQVTTDHSVVQELVDAGQISPSEAMVHPRRNEITRVLGYGAGSVPDLIQIKLYAGDNILLCSDGLCGVLPPGRIEETVLASQNAGQACDDLTLQANLAGGPDNISVIIARPDGLPSWQALISAKTGFGTA
jgi:serine/threonine protein phosphatase PrpC